MKKKEYYEILAPAGDFLNLIGAINSGANAIYLSGQNFGARKFAANFTNEQLVEAIIYAHLRNVKIFVTINTLIYDNEIPKLIEYCDFLVMNNVDGFIVSDLGVINLCIKRYPNTEIHASTQCNIKSLTEAQYFYDLGVKRIVLAREVSLAIIEEISQAIPELDLEVFVHGALCIAESGQCLVGALEYSRSGNRGMCNGVCRMKYDILDENSNIINKEDKYVLSARDLNISEYFERLIKIGVKSFKIEGRMRSFSYVVSSVILYRYLLDACLNDIKFDSTYLEELKKDCLKSFNRKYTKGFLNYENPSEIVNASKPNHQGIIIGKIIESNLKMVKIKLSEDLLVGSGIRLLLATGEEYGFVVYNMIVNNEEVKRANSGETISVKCSKLFKVGSTVSVTSDELMRKKFEKYTSNNFDLIPLNVLIKGEMGGNLEVDILSIRGFRKKVYLETKIETSKNEAIPLKEILLQQFLKLGNTPFYLKDFKYNGCEYGYVSLKEVNNARKYIVDSLKEEILVRNYPSINDFSLGENIESFSTKKVVESSSICFKKNEISSQYITKTKTYNFEELKNKARILVDDLDTLIKVMKYLKENNLFIEVYTSIHFNVANMQTVLALMKLGVTHVVLSLEMNERQIQKLISLCKSNPELNDVKIGILKNGTPVLMYLKYDLYKKFKLDDTKTYILKSYDKRKYVINKDHNTTVLRSEKSLKQVNNQYVNFELSIE